MAFGQYILEMEVLVAEALRNTVDCTCSETLEPSPCTSGQTTVEIRRVARNSQWGGCLGGLAAAGGQWGSGGKVPSCRRLGVWGQSPQPPEARGSGGGAPSARKFCILLQK